MVDTVEIEYEGKRYVAEYHVEDGVVTVFGHQHSRMAELGDKDKLSLAKELLLDMASSQINEISPER